MRTFLIIFFALIAAASCRKKCHPVEKPRCLPGEVYLEKGPGPFCYPTCCGPKGPPCRMDSFTSGCFCANDGEIKKFPVANNTFADPKNPCVKECQFDTCYEELCTGANQEYRDCGPTSMCDNQVCRGMRPICTEEDAAVCVAGCFCKPGYSNFGGECVEQCPLLP